MWGVLSVFEKFLFRPSTHTRENGVFLKFNSGERFQNVPFSLIVFIGYVWTEAISVKKKSRSNQNGSVWTGPSRVATAKKFDRKLHASSYTC